MKHFNFLFILMLSLMSASCANYYYGVGSYSVMTTDTTSVTATDNFGNALLAVSNEKFAVGYSPEGACVVSNLSDSTMFVDMGESYVIDRTGQASRLFTNAVTSSYNSGTSGASVNLGAVAGAFGIGGAIGSLARGINVGGASTSGTTVQTFEERYISVPPRSSVQVKFTYMATQLERKLPKYQPIQYNLNNTPTVKGHHLTYTFNPEGKDWKSIRNYLYLDGMTRVNNKKEANAMVNGDPRKSVIKRENTAGQVGNILLGVLGGTALLEALIFAIVYAAS